VSTEQKQNLGTILRQSAFPADMEADPLLSRENLQARVPDYTAGQDAAAGLVSPVFADLSGLPPLIIQAGSHEVLLDDAVRLARQAAALDRAGQLLSAHLASVEPVTA
jgi:acetyl esterase/lipase